MKKEHPQTETAERVKYNLKRYREAAGITQAEVGDRAGYTQGQVSHLELGRRKLKVNQLIAQAEAIGISAADLFESSTYTEDEYKLVLKFHKLLRNKKSVEGWGIIENIIVTTEVPPKKPAKN